MLLKQQTPTFDLSGFVVFKTNILSFSSENLSLSGNRNIRLSRNPPRNTDIGLFLEGRESNLLFPSGQIFANNKSNHIAYHFAVVLCGLNKIHVRQ